MRKIRTKRNTFTRGQKAWTKREEAVLRKYYRHMPTKWLERKLKRTAYSIRWRASQLQIRKARPTIWRANG